MDVDQQRGEQNETQEANDAKYSITFRMMKLYLTTLLILVNKKHSIQVTMYEIFKAERQT